MSVDKSHSISIIRTIAMLFIVITHIFQALNNELAWWFNVGVAIFLFMSGFLYGMKNIKNPIKWIGKRLIVIIVPYYIYILIIIPVFYFWGNNIFNMHDIIPYIFLLQAFFDGISGLGHLWFISIIIICYILTPILQRIKIEKTNNEIRFWISIFTIIFFIQLASAPFILRYYVPNIASYIVGYFISKRYITKDFKIRIKSNFKIVYIISVILTFLLNSLKIYFIYFGDRTYLGIIGILVDLISKYSHTILGCTLFLTIYVVIEKFYFKINDTDLLIKFVKFTDNLSYEIYITHHIYILSVFSLMFITKSILFNIVLIILATIFSSLLLKAMSNRFKNLLN